MKILVTGGRGFLGSHLVKRLRELGHEVLAPTHGRGWWADEIDVCNHPSCAQIVGWKPEVVYHLAGLTVTGQGLGDSAELFRVNTLGTINVFEAALKAGVKRFIHMGTSESYGHIPGSERAIPRPLTPYGLSKQAAEDYCLMRETGSMGVVCLRGFNTYGPGQSIDRWIPRVIVKCLRGETVESTKGEQTRDYVYIDDMIDGLVAAGETEGTGVLNLCTGKEVSIAALNLKIRELTESKSEIILGALPYRSPEIWRMVGDNKCAAAVLRWHPKVSLDEGLKRTIQWYKEQPFCV